MKPALRFFVFAGVATALCLTIGCQNSSSQTSKKDGINIFDKNASVPRREIRRPVNDNLNRISRAFKEESPEMAQTWRSFLYYGMFFVVVAIVVGCLIYWQVLSQKKMDWEMNDPKALVQELNYVHQLSEQEKHVMQELSDKNALPSPLKLFVEPDFLLKALESDSFTPARSTVRQLLSKLFDITPEDSETSAVLSGMNSKTTLYSPRTQV